MYLFKLILCSVILVTSGNGENSTISKLNETGNHNLTSVGPKIDLLNTTKLTLVSEGGTILPMPNTLAKQKLNSLITLDEELSKTKEKPVVPRKGVGNMLADVITDEKPAVKPENHTTSNVTESLNTTSALLPAVPLDKNVTSAPLSTSTTAIILNSTIHHKKPLILSAEALANWDKKIESEKPKIHAAPSTETMASSQIPSPRQDTIVKVYPKKANNSHPGMIMPIVITILVVPMFAIVGYMALKRGQEAWKNRHYKRMDFLLDGMYND